MRHPMRRTFLVLLAALVAVLAIGTAVVATGGSSTVTRPRLERALPATFAHLYVKQARILGRTGVTVPSLHATAMCDKHGADVADVGPGGDWVCLMSWTDPRVPMPSEGYGKFELNVHSNDCFTASGPSKLVGFLTLTDRRGSEVDNPVFEFDGCFDPGADNTATGHEFPSLLGVVSTHLTPDRRGRAGVQLSCGAGSAGCSGTLVAAARGTRLGTVPFTLKEQTTREVRLARAVPGDAREATLTLSTTDAVAPSSPVTLQVEGR